MCGIAGFTNFTGRDEGGGEGAIRAMTAALQHRGPDGEGYFADDVIRIGHRRLAVIDVPGGAQPMISRDGRHVLVYNGEVYNYVELRRELEARGVSFRTKSDTEVVLEALALDGIAALSRFNGMFAFAFWDRAERRLLLARDRTGIKPLLYQAVGGDLVFASELKALRKFPGVRLEIDPASVSKYFTYGYISAPHTIYKEVRKLEPGTCLEISAAGVRETRYWDIPLTDNPVSVRDFDECCADVEGLLRAAVRGQLRSDVPVGVLLSGGLDSSAITALAARESPAPIHTFSIGFDEPTHDESRYAAQVSRLFGTIHHQETLTLGDATRLFPETIRILDEPLADASIIQTYFLSRLASQHVKVVLGGDGSDELFAGYAAFQAHRTVERLSFLPTSAREWLARAARGVPVSHHYASTGYLLQQFLKGAGLSAEARFIIWLGCFGSREKRQLFSDGMSQTLAAGDEFEDLMAHVRRSGLNDTFQRLLYLCTKLYFQDDILVKLDRASMAHSVEARVPFMDSALVDYACGIQPFYKLNGLKTKYVLKHALKSLLPAEIIHRRKAGFMMPVARWLAGPMREAIEDYCSPAELEATGFFNASYVRQMLDEHFERRRDHRKHIYPLLCFMAWMREQKTN
jgi:asparagine synthase (glutamine-hydrolysing)